MDPRSKFVTPQPAAPTFAEMSKRRTGTAAPALSTNFVFSKDHPESATSPKSPWRRFFHRSLICRSSENRDRSSNGADHGSLISATANCDPRPLSPSEGANTRDISPASLRRPVVEKADTFTRPDSRGSISPSSRARTPPLDVLDQVDEDDDDNFVGALDDFLSRAFIHNPALSATVQKGSGYELFCSDRGAITSSPLDIIHTAPTTCKIIDAREPESATNSPASPTLEDFPLSSDISSFDGESQDDDDSERFSCPGREDVHVGHEAARANKHVKGPSTASFSRYRLPQLTFSTDKLPLAEDKLSTSPRFTTMTSPLLLPGSGQPVSSNGDSNLLGSSLGTGLDDFASELSWLTDSITSRR
ncbi:hypothetical protein BM221_001674 [Beauveria bassiana]|uniref:Uncharacterized protein n=1 Tax=Beauveria bassiana TaxID=176275 RepID=A0A2N6NWD9_BEABA|nr:hypothetical protein BM221_001674 [Beauveria bassiana]